LTITGGLELNADVSKSFKHKRMTVIRRPKMRNDPEITAIPETSFQLSAWRHFFALI
jgi:hypothetical protein